MVKNIVVIAYDLGVGGSEANCANSWIHKLESYGFKLVIYTRSSSKTNREVVRVSDNYFFLKHVNSPLRFYLTFWIWKRRLARHIKLQGDEVIWWLTPMGVKNIPRWIFKYNNVVLGPLGGASFVTSRTTSLRFWFNAIVYNLFVAIWRMRLMSIQCAGRKARWIASDSGTLEFFQSKAWNAIWSLDVWPRDVLISPMIEDIKSGKALVPLRDNWRKGKYNWKVLKGLNEIDLYSFFRFYHSKHVIISPMPREEFLVYLKQFKVMLLFSEKDGFTSTFAEGLESGLLPIVIGVKTGYGHFLNKYCVDLITSVYSDEIIHCNLECYSAYLERIRDGIQLEDKILLDFIAEC